ncbi:hypothetical protein B0H17DRAFT_1147151 [Mycena rosella]|uniref:F-box domain-containing protein n=1 Tax=Mycena rosella TaxID=1033263 RepID=A0AAD7CPR4_MYCRO|nr:hypothetical protein B0H17DRAFT_1147151 [Mycena rosella]
MSIAELEARIDKISAEIVRQKEVLKNLQRSKSIAQRDLNAIRDPVARLPLEISSEIFIQCLPSDPEPDPRHAPYAVSDHIALATTELWASINLDDQRSGPASLLETWLKRAGSRALSISLPHRITGEISAVIGRHADRLRDLKMYHDDDDISLISTAGFPFLEILTMSGVDTDRFNCSTIGTINILRACSNLVQCTFDNVFCYDGYAEGILVFPRVRSLNFGKYPMGYGDDSILRHITLPGLQTLCISLNDIKPQDLLRFVSRSLPLLRQIVMGDTGWPEWTRDELEECLSLLPTLTHFELFNPRWATLNHFIAILAGSPHLPPNLSTVTLRLAHSPARLWHQNLLHALLARSKQLHVVRVIWDGGSEGPPEDVAIQLRQLVADGMSIHVGTQDRNLFKVPFPSYNLTLTVTDD